MEEGEYPRFTYSIGIQEETSKPEIIVTGLKQELAHWLVNEYNNRVREGEQIEAGKYYEDFLEGFKVTFRLVEKKHYDEYFGWAKWFYDGDNFQVLQLIYPSTSGIWPWDDEAVEEYKWFVPQLYKADDP